MSIVLGEDFHCHVFDSALLALTCGPTKPNPMTKKKRRQGKTIKSSIISIVATWNRNVENGSLRVNRLKPDRTTETPTLTLSRAGVMSSAKIYGYSKLECSD
jgi:hypothetical protein